MTFTCEESDQRMALMAVCWYLSCHLTSWYGVLFFLITGRICSCLEKYRDLSTPCSVRIVDKMIAKRITVSLLHVFKLQPNQVCHKHLLFFSLINTKNLLQPFQVCFYLHSSSSSFSIFISCANSISNAPLLLGRGKPMLRILFLIVVCIFLSKSDIGGCANCKKKNIARVIVLRTSISCYTVYF